MFSSGTEAPKRNGKTHLPTTWHVKCNTWWNQDPSSFSSEATAQLFNCWKGMCTDKKTAFKKLSHNVWFLDCLDPSKRLRANLNPNAKTRTSSRQAGARQGAGLHKETKNRSRKFGQETKFPREILVPRNDKLSQVTVYLFLGLKTAAVFLFRNYYKTKRSAPLQSAFELIPFSSTQEYIGGWIKSGMSLQDPALFHTPGHVWMCN